MILVDYYSEDEQKIRSHFIANKKNDLKMSITKKETTIERQLNG